MLFEVANLTPSIPRLKRLSRPLLLQLPRILMVCKLRYRPDHIKDILIFNSAAVAAATACLHSDHWGYKSTGAQRAVVMKKLY
jgi:hypothetical protein